MTIQKLDLKKELKHLYSAKKKPQIVDVPEGLFLSILGKGAPGGPEYADALGALYGAAYTLKFKSKAEGRDYTVMPLEGLWWWDDKKAFTLEDAPPRETWNWNNLLRVPDFTTEEELTAIKPELIEKKGSAVERIKLWSFTEGLSAQIMHKGPYSEEQPTVDILNTFLDEQGYRLRDHHHEIYLSNPNRSKPENHHQAPD